MRLMHRPALTPDQQHAKTLRSVWGAVAVFGFMLVLNYILVIGLFIQLNNIRDFQDSGKVRGDRTAARQCLMMEAAGVEDNTLCDDPGIRALMAGGG